jgi:hypothetical protein
MPDRSFNITSSWPSDNMTPSEIGDRFLNTLEKLGKLGPPMGNWLLGDSRKRRWVPLATAAPDIVGLVERGVSRDDYGKREPRGGYSLLAKGSKVPSQYGASDSVNISTTAGGQWGNQIELKFGAYQAPPDADLTTYPIYRGVVETLASVWPCPWVFAYTWTPDDVPIIPWDRVTPLWEWKPPRGRHRRWFEVAWVAYLSASLAKDLTPPAEILCESTPGGGVILSSVLERLDEANQDHMRRALALESILDERIGPQGFGPDRVEHPTRVGPY